MGGKRAIAKTSDTLVVSVVLLIVAVGIWALIWVISGGLRRAGRRFYFGCFTFLGIWLLCEAVFAYLASNKLPWCNPEKHL